MKNQHLQKQGESLTNSEFLQKLMVIGSKCDLSEEEELNVVMGDSQRKLTRGESQQKDSFNSAYNNFQDSNGLTDIKFRRKYKNNKKNFAIFKMKPTKSPLMKMDKLSHQSRSKTKLDGNFCMK